MIGNLLMLPLRIGVFALWFAGAILKSSVQVLADILTPGHGATPRVVRMPLGTAGDAHVTAIGALITLTPGTLTLGADVDSDGERSILVHSMYHPDAAAALADLHDMDRRLIRAVRVEGGAP